MRSIGDLVRELVATLETRRSRFSYSTARFALPVDERLEPVIRVVCPWCLATGGPDCACRGRGLVCPRCRGARLVRHEFPDGGYTPASPCPECTDADGHYDPQREVRAIAQYLASDREKLNLLRQYVAQSRGVTV
jgi:hypothetical protein